MKRIALASEDALAGVAGRASARKVVAHLRGGASPEVPGAGASEADDQAA